VLKHFRQLDLRITSVCLEPRQSLLCDTVLQILEAAAPDIAAYLGAYAKPGSPPQSTYHTA